MKDRLEDFMRDHRLEFDRFEPDDKLWDKIEKKLDVNEDNFKKIRKHSFTYYLTRAASVAAIFMLSFFAQQYFLSDRGEVVIPELQEAEVYYSSLMKLKMEQVKPMLAKHPGLEEELTHDLSELDSIYKSLKEDLKDNISNQEVLEAMISNYRLRIDILEEMVLYLDEDNEITNRNNNSEYDL